MWAKPFNNDLKHVLHNQGDAAGRPRGYYNGENSFGWLAFPRRSQSSAVMMDDGHTRRCERQLTCILFYFHIILEYQKREHGKHFFRERTSAMSTKKCPACLAPRRKLTCQPRHTNKGEGGFSMGGTLATATEKPDRSGGESQFSGSLLLDIALGGTKAAGKERGWPGSRISAMPFWGGVEGGEGNDEEREAQ